jgi:BTB/POZ domain-containing protein 13
VGRTNHHEAMIYNKTLIFTHVNKSVFSVDLMEKVIKSPNLFVMQIEVDIYNLAKMWMFLKLNSSWEGKKKDLLSDANAHFQARTGDRAFLETDEGSKYTCVFQAVRLHNVICDVKAVRQLDQDKIIPNGKDFCRHFMLYTH